LEGHTAKHLERMDTPAKRIQWAIERRGMGVRELARRLGVSPGLPSQWWRTGGRATSPDSHLDEISEILQANVDWLRYGRGEPFRSVVRNQQELGAPLDTSRARIVGIVEGEVWREGISMREAMAAGDSGAPTLQVVSREDLQGFEQFAVEVRGHVCDQTIPPGNFAIYVDYNLSRPSGPVEGDLVVVERRRGGEIKALIARLHFVNGAWELHYESNDPRWQREKPIRLSEDRKHDANDGLALDIVGHVRSFVSQDPQPRFGRETAPVRAAWRARRSFSLPLLMMSGSIALITGVLSALGGEQFSPFAVFFYLAATLVVGLKFGTILAIASTWLSVVIGGIVLYEPTFTLRIENPVSMRSLIAYVFIAMAASVVLSRARNRTRKTLVI
jgi:transcriptional regulator with XRE-family HTH domain